MAADDVLLWLLATLAAYRLWRLLALDDLPYLSDVRERFEDWLDVRAGNRWAAGVACPWCSGFWCCVAVFSALTWWVSVPLIAVQIAAASTVVGLIGSRMDA